MPTWRIGLTQTVIEGCTVTVEAATADEAKQQAIETALMCDVQWSYYDGLGQVEVATIDKEPDIGQLTDDQLADALIEQKEK
jgi:hypothetical protein